MTGAPLSLFGEGEPRSDAGTSWVIEEPGRSR